MNEEHSSARQQVASDRNTYDVGELREADMLDNAVDQFARWMKQAFEADVFEPNAMAVSSVSDDGQPSSRMVLLRDFSEQGFVFFTNLQSRKGRELVANPKAALLFYWPQMHRQIAVRGPVEVVERDHVQQYFDERPRMSRIAAWASAQSSPLSSRDELDRLVSEATDQFGAEETDGPIPAPDWWGGLRVVPEEMEFWQGRPSRLHDRFGYQKSADGWTHQRLAP